MVVGDIITLQPGAAGSGWGDVSPQTRPDWSPFAQSPDPVTGVIAHTPDPTQYHEAGGRTMLPRSKPGFGSRGFTTRPGIVTIDPDDPVKATGGFKVDMEKITKRSANHAVMNADGNPLMAWAIAAHAQAQPYQLTPDQAQPRVAPQGFGGSYVVPAATPGGLQIHAPPQQQMPMSPASQALGGGGMQSTGVVHNPSVKPPGGPGMSVPTFMDAPSGAPVSAQPHPVAHSPDQPAWAQPQSQPQQHQPPPQHQYPPPPPVHAYPPQAYPQQMHFNSYPAPPPQQTHVPQAAPPQAPDPTQLLMLQVLQGLAKQLSGQNGHASAAEPIVPEPPSNWRADKEAMLQERRQHRKVDQRRPRRPPPRDEDLDEEMDEAMPDLDVPEDTGLDFLTNPPSPPRIQVVFDLGPGGRHLKRFHHTAVSGWWLTLVYDSRFEGDQFIPPPTGDDGPPIRLTFPQTGRTCLAIVPNGANQRIGCMDLINFCILREPPDQQQTAPTFDMFGQGGQQIREMSHEMGWSP